VGVLAGVVRAGLAGTGLCLLGAAVGQEYVGARYFSVIWPGLVGLACAVAALALGGACRPGVLRLVGAGYGVLSALYDFRFATDPFGPPGRWVPPVAAAALAALLLPGLVMSAPSRRAAPAGTRRSSRGAARRPPSWWR
jgi:hypothetical protein